MKRLESEELRARPLRRAASALLAGALLVLTGCAGAPEGVEPVTHFDAERYLGRWYEVARLDNRFERGLDNVTATYSSREDGGVRVVNQGINLESGEKSEAIGKAYFRGPRTVGALKVSFFGPFYGGYNVFALDPDYQWAMVAGPDRSYLWILSRTPSLPEGIREKLVARAAELGFPVKELYWTRQSAGA